MEKLIVIVSHLFFNSFKRSKLITNSTITALHVPFHPFHIRFLLRLLLLSSLSFLLIGCAGGPFGPPATPTVDPVVLRGKKVFSQHCGSCHVTVPDTVIVGPSLANLATRAGSRVEGLDAKQYIQMSISNPSAYLVEGFEDLMPSTLAKKLTGEELDDLMAYLLTLE